MVPNAARLVESDERGRRRVPRRWLDAEHASFMDKAWRGPESREIDGATLRRKPVSCQLPVFSCQREEGGCERAVARRQLRRPHACLRRATVGHQPERLIPGIDWSYSALANVRSHFAGIVPASCREHRLLSMPRVVLFGIRIRIIPFTNFNFVTSWSGGFFDKPREHLQPSHKPPHRTYVDAGRKCCLFKIVHCMNVTDLRN